MNSIIQWEYGRVASMRCCARRRRAAATISMALVIFLVFWYGGDPPLEVFLSCHVPCRYPRPRPS